MCIPLSANAPGFCASTVAVQACRWRSSALEEKIQTATMSDSGASPEVLHDDHDEEQVDLDGDVEPEEMMDDDVEGEGEEEEEEEEEEERGSQDDQDASVPNGSHEKMSEDDGRNDIVEDASPLQAHGQSGDISEKDKNKNSDLLSHPPHGSEIFIGGVPREATEEDLRSLCETYGDIYEIRLMKSKEKGENKGYAFVSFTTKEDAVKATKALNGTEWKGRNLRCSQSQAKHRLFIGNIPKNWDKEELEKKIDESGPGIQSVELLKDPHNEGRNRGFAFVEYYNHACAENARQNMSNPNFKLDNRAPTVSWADPKAAPPDINEVKAVYVCNLPDNVTQEQLKELFERHGEITKVVLPLPKAGQTKREFGFVHFAERESALKAIEKTEKYELEGHVLDASLARPQFDRKSSMDATHRTGLFPNYQARVGYGFAGDMYGTVGTGYGATRGYAQPMIYGRGPTPAGMTMVPMMLPDGRIGYVLQQPGSQAAEPVPYRAERTGGGGRQGGGNSGGRRYRPY
eukprot:Gb_21901 [translate_table: standard]